MTNDDELASAFRSVREAYDGESNDANLTLQRALLRSRSRERKRRFSRWVVLPMAAALLASTAWAAVTGRLVPVAERVFETSHPVTVTAPPSMVTAPVTRVTTFPVLAPEAAPRLVPASTTAAPSPPVVHPTPRRVDVPSSPVELVPESPVVAQRPAPAAPPPAVADPAADLFAEAHRLHFATHEPVRALAAWDRYLEAAPSGRFAPEARYNRALTLVRLGRRTEAMQALSAFADGTFGEYRRAEARALLEALGKDAAATP